MPQCAGPRRPRFSARAMREGHCSAPPRRHDTQREDAGAPRTGAGSERARRGVSAVACRPARPCSRVTPGSRRPLCQGAGGERSAGLGSAGAPPECSTWGSGRQRDGGPSPGRARPAPDTSPEAGRRAPSRPANTVSTGKFALSPRNCLANRRWNPTRPQFGDNVYSFLVWTKRPQSNKNYASTAK